MTGERAPVDVDLHALPFEAEPNREQAERLHGLLKDLAEICYRHNIVLHSDDVTGEVRAIDMVRQTVIGVGLSPLFGLVTAREEGPFYDIHFDMVGSVHDGSWLVESRAGLVEQRHLPPGA